MTRKVRSAAGKAFLDMLGVFAEFETSLRRERQLEGIEAAKARGSPMGSGDGARLLAIADSLALEEYGRL